MLWATLNLRYVSAFHVLPQRFGGKFSLATLGDFPSKLQNKILDEFEVKLHPVTSSGTLLHVYYI